MKIFVQTIHKDIKNYEQAIKIAAKPMIENDVINSEFVNACIQREKSFPTGLQVNDKLGIAIPHGNQKLVKKSAISFVRFSPKTVKFGRMDDNSKVVNCEYLFNLALSKGDEHLTVLRKLMHLFADKSFVFHLNHDNKEQLNSFLVKELS